MTTESESSRTRDPGHAWPLALALVATGAAAMLKAAIAIREGSPGGLGLKVFDPGGAPAGFIGRLAACVAEDAALWIVVAAVAARVRASAVAETGAGPEAAGGPTRGRVATWIAATVAAAGAALTVVNVQVFRAMSRFVDHSLLVIARDGGHGYVEAFAPPAFWAALVIVPLAVLGGAALLSRFWTEELARAGRLLLHPVSTIALAGGLIWTGARVGTASCPPGRPDFARAPLLVLLRSSLPASSLRGDAELSAEEVAEFLPAPGTSASGAPGRIRNVVLVVWDGVPASTLSIHGSAQPTTPKLAARAATSLIFDNAYSNATQSSPSCLTLFGSTLNDPTVYVTLATHPRFPVPHVAEWLEGHGRRTFFVGDDGWMGLGPHLLHPRFQVAIDSGKDWSRKTTSYENTRFQDASTSFGLARRFLRDVGHDPFFITVWSSEAHPPFRAAPCPARFDPAAFPPVSPGRQLEHERFLQCVWRLDAELDGLMGELESLGLAEETLVVLTSDHGCGWGQHGYFGYGAGLYDEIVHVPLVMMSPGLPRTGRHAGVASHVDLWPTIAGLMGLAPHPAWQGRNLLAPGATGRAYFSATNQMGLREGPYKLIWDHAADRRELYDLVADPAELQDLAAQRPEVVTKMERRLVALATYQPGMIREKAAAAR